MANPTARLQAYIEKRRMKRRERLEKVVELAAQRYSITNNDVQILLGVSDATATRYLEELVRDGRIERVGPQFQPQYRLKSAQV